ncbi:MAG TPA: hypothetical protein VFI38_15350 [Candidatus Acidoferrum sp.]|nr:hypothetical protein [Candidatus Acidoferrum sp.]
MLSNRKHRVSLLKLAILIATVSVWLAGGAASPAQQTTDPPPAPVPRPILAAKKVFISNATGEIPMPQEALDLAYNEFYASIKNWGRYELAADPSDADLIFEIRYHYSVGPTGVTDGNGGSTEVFQLRITILDSKTRTILWSLSKNIPQSKDKIKSRNYFDQTMSALVDNLNKLASQPSTPTADPKK